MLVEILAHKRREVAVTREQRPLARLEREVKNLPLTGDFSAALRRQGAGLNLIAELKQASPSRGLIRAAFDLEEQARLYTAAGAAAISVLTDWRFFKGKPEYLSRVRQVTSLPLLRKDFIVDPYQIYEARALGADAVLLIVAALEPAELQEYLALADRLKLGALVEVHTEAEVEVALQAGAGIIGINNRDLRTFKVDLHTTLALRPLIPPGPVVVSESGIMSRADAALVAEAGVDAILVGEALMTAGDVRAKAAELCLSQEPYAAIVVTSEG
ncbi:Aldolase-type TIM barrel [Moorella glycerini]|uniref:Indole-3-glycerol phosphate synthase n=1 Tax=Neomoorella stamsii TaxID=1266720 RepID=A0A9X7P6F7_9FIRM|nr:MULTISPECIES: indole-3-glycerol phosphate synthase TrpC [Moorella]PRR73040.1 Indole-3-glycerol phosphate synthase [Moorella stamsii]CEP69630.1 Aldolase-type TIM barrel [Moorella glycerini]